MYSIISTQMDLPDDIMQSNTIIEMMPKKKCDDAIIGSLIIFICMILYCFMLTYAHSEELKKTKAETESYKSILIRSIDAALIRSMHMDIDKDE